MPSDTLETAAMPSTLPAPAKGKKSLEAAPVEAADDFADLVTDDKSVDALYQHRMEELAISGRKMQGGGIGAELSLPTGLDNAKKVFMWAPPNARGLFPVTPKTDPDVPKQYFTPGNPPSIRVMLQQGGGEMQLWWVYREDRNAAIAHNNAHFDKLAGGLYAGYDKDAERQAFGIRYDRMKNAQDKSSISVPVSAPLE